MILVAPGLGAPGSPSTQPGGRPAERGALGGALYGLGAHDGAGVGRGTWGVTGVDLDALDNSRRV